MSLRDDLIQEILEEHFSKTENGDMWLYGPITCKIEGVEFDITVWKNEGKMGIQIRSAKPSRIEVIQRNIELV